MKRYESIKETEIRVLVDNIETDFKRLSEISNYERMALLIERLHQLNKAKRILK